MDSLSAPVEGALLYKNFHQNPALVVRSSSGIYLQINDGRQILDATSGAAVACLGYGNKSVQKAMVEQMNTISYCHPGFYKAQVAEDLADHLVSSTNGHMAKAALVGSGSEAVEVAVKLAKTYFSQLSPPQLLRDQFIARKGAWHGATLGALSFGDFKGRKDPFLALLSQNVSQVSACSEYRGKLAGEKDSDYVARLAQELEDEFQRVGPSRVCAFIAETVGGSSTGCATPVPGYFAAMKRVCQRHGALLILDEVMCGMGRTGTVHAWEQEGVAPDLQTVGKGLGAGYGTISAVLLNTWLVEAFRAGGQGFAHGQTYMAHPLSAAAALRVQQIIHEEDLLSNVRKMGILLERQLKCRLQEHRFVGDIRGRGLFWAVEFVADKATKEPFASKLNVNGRLHSRGLCKGYDIALFNAPGTKNGYEGDHVVLAPPYIVTEADVIEIVDRLCRVIDDTFAQLGL